MIWVEGQTIENQEIKLDFTRWKKCVFNKCNIIVKYGEFDIVDCGFNDCKITFDGNALVIMKFAKLFVPQLPV